MRYRVIVRQFRSKKACNNAMEQVRALGFDAYECEGLTRGLYAIFYSLEDDSLFAASEDAKE